MWHKDSKSYLYLVPLKDKISSHMHIHYDPIKGKTCEIVDALMSSEHMAEDEDLRFKLRLCIEEVVENIVQYAYKNGEGFIDVTTSLSDGLLSITLEDSGVPFNPLAKEDPDITLSAEERPIGGLGIFICKQMMDDLSYVYRDGRNIFTMKKKIN